LTVKKRGPTRAEPPVKKNNWRQKHEEFVRSIRAARGVQAAMDRGEPLPPPPPPTINPDYVQCDFCGRRFNESAAARHIVFCKEQHERLPKKKPEQMTAAQKMAVRTQYQPPKIKKAVGPSASSRIVMDDSYDSPIQSTNQQRAANSGYNPSRQRGAYNSSDRSTRNMLDYSQTDGPLSGQALRTGRTVETYSEARKLSAKQRAAIPSRKYPSSDNLQTYTSPQYTGTGYVRTPSGPTSYRSTGGTGSKPGSGRATSTVTRDESWNSYGATYGYGSPGTVPRGRGVAGRPANSGGGTGTVASAGRFCYDCGAKFPVPTAKFCCECGLPRQS
jgi:hypothetical protein